MTKYLLCLAVVVFASFSAFSQNKFEGYNVVVSVPTNHRIATCAIRFVPPTTTISIADLDRATPLKLNACGGSGTSLVSSSATSATFRASATNYKWCFEGEDKLYRVTFQGEQYSGPVTYDWPAEPDPRTAGFYNIRDFGAVGDGKTDDTIAVKSAFAFIAVRNGGTLTFPEGDYLVNGPIALPSGITIQGTNGLPSLSPTNVLPRINPARIRLTGQKKALFQSNDTRHRTDRRQ